MTFIITFFKVFPMTSLQFESVIYYVPVNAIYLRTERVNLNQIPVPLVQNIMITHFVYLNIYLSLNSQMLTFVYMPSFNFTHSVLKYKGSKQPQCIWSYGLLGPYEWFMCQ